MLRPKPAEKGRAGTANMQITRRRWRKPSYYFFGHNLKFSPVSKKIQNNNIKLQNDYCQEPDGNMGKLMAIIPKIDLLQNSNTTIF